MTETEIYQTLVNLTKTRDQWQKQLPIVSSFLSHESVRIQAKALWLTGEMGLANPVSVKDTVPKIASFLDSPEALLRERALNALGRIGRADYALIEPYWADLFRFAGDEAAKVRLSFIWASENVATNTPDIYEGRMPVFEKLLHDADEKVLMEAPEVFRVIGKRRPALVAPYLETLRGLSETDGSRVVRLHCLGAVRATLTAQKPSETRGIGNAGTITDEIS